MTRLLVLGGARKSRRMVECAIQQGLEVILCDQDPEVPCRSLATAFERVSTLNVPALVRVGRAYGVDGVVSYGSDRMAESTADVAAALGLPGNPPEAVRDMGNKDRFRRRLAALGLSVPRFGAFRQLPSQEHIECIGYPVIVKPVDGAGSAGVSRVESWAQLPDAFRAAQESSPSRTVMVEEFIERDHPHMIGGDVFVADGKVVFWGLLNSHRALEDRPFLPTGTSWPVDISADRQERVREAVQAFISGVGLRFGGCNIEILFDRRERLLILEMAARNGGNAIPELLQMATGFDLNAALVNASLGRKVVVPQVTTERLVANYMLHAERAGMLRGYDVSREIEEFVRDVQLDAALNSPVARFDRATAAVGVVTFSFPSRLQQRWVLAQLPKAVRVVSSDE